MQDLKIEYLRPQDLTPYDHNARKHEAADIDAIKASIRDCGGFNDPIGIWGGQNLIVEGHGRQIAAIEMGLERVPCVRLDHLTEEQRRAYALAHNKTAELSAWDFDEMEREVEALTLEGFDMAALGFDVPDIEELGEIVEDEPPEPPEEPTARLGDIYQLGQHRLMCGDSTDAEAWERLMDGKKGNMVFTDPPYNVAIGSKNAFLNTIHKSGRITEDIEGDKGMTDDEIGESLWKPAFQNLADYSEDDASIYVTMPQGGAHMMMMMMMARSSWQVKHELIWMKNAPTFSMGRLDYDYKHEPIMYGWKKTHNFYGNGEQTKSVWEYNKPLKCDLHPTMKPVPLIANAIKNSSQKGDVILDAFGGSGSTLIACEQTGRRCYMMELDPRYVDVIIERWEKLTGKKAALVNG